MSMRPLRTMLGSCRQEGKGGREQAWTSAHARPNTPNKSINCATPATQGCFKGALPCIPKLLHGSCCSDHPAAGFTHIKIVKDHGFAAALQQIAVDASKEVWEAAVHALHAAAVAADLPVLQAASATQSSRLSICLRDRGAHVSATIRLSDATQLHSGRQQTAKEAPHSPGTWARVRWPSRR